jgi:AAA ATPase domain
MSKAAANNPYDFRNPVARRGLLAGRDWEIEQVDEFLREAAAGRSSYFSLFGGAGMGKSSLLNASAEIAWGRKLLPVRLEVLESTVESSLTFYAAVFDAALAALIDKGALTDEDPLMGSWRRHTLAGEVGDPTDLTPRLETGLLVAARMSGKMVDEVPLAALRRDSATVLEHCERAGLRGVVLCLDSAERIDENRDLAPSLMQLAQSIPGLNLLTAAEKGGGLQKASPRAWSQIEVGPFANPPSIFDAIMRPLADVEGLELAPAPATAQDILLMTEGRPYEVNLVNHFIWEAITQGEQDQFVLSKPVIERVLLELEERGRLEESETIAAIRKLGAADLEAVSRLVPFEGLTIRQLALGRLMFEDFDEEGLEEAERQVAGDLDRLSQADIMEISHDRFKLNGGPEARLYLRYAAEQRVGRRIAYRDTYARQALAVCRARLGEELLGADFDSKLLRGSWSSRELGEVVVGRWVEELADSVTEQNLGALNELMPGFAEEELAEFAEKGGLMFGFTIQVGLESVEYADIGINVEELDSDDARAKIDSWIEANRQQLAKYEISFEMTRCEQLSPALAKSVAAYSELDRYCMLAVFMHRAGFVRGAIDALTHCINECEALIGDDPTDPLLRAELADALNRAGFMQATEGLWEDSEANLRRSLELSLAEEWLTVFNLSYIKANLGGFGEAIELCERAGETACPTDTHLILHAWFPTPEDWGAEARSSVVEMRGRWAERFMELQAAVYAAREDQTGNDRLKDLLDGLSQSSPPALLRLAGWAELVILERGQRAIEFFEHALNATGLEEMDVVADELAYARRSVPQVVDAG